MRADLAGVRATLEATFSSSTQSPHVIATPGLQLRGPFLARDALPLFLMKNVTAGVLARDRYDVSLTTLPGARVRVSTTSATRVFTMPHDRAETHLSLRAREGSRLMYTPAPTILQAGSDLHQTTRIVADHGSTAVVSDIVVFGRLARGERFDFRRFSNELSLTHSVDDPPYFVQRFVLAPGRGSGVEGSVGGYGVLGTLVVAAPDVTRDLDRIRATIVASQDCHAGASRLPGNEAVIVQALAWRADAVQRVLRSAESAIMCDLKIT